MHSLFLDDAAVVINGTALITRPKKVEMISSEVNFGYFNKIFYTKDGFLAFGDIETICVKYCACTSL